MALTDYGERAPTAGMLLLLELFSRCRQFFELLVVQLRVLQVQARQRIHDCRHHNQAREPLVVGRYNHPWRVLRPRCFESFFRKHLDSRPSVSARECLRPRTSSASSDLRGVPGIAASALSWKHLERTSG